jgi:hypothetical protein
VRAAGVAEPGQPITTSRYPRCFSSILDPQSSILDPAQSILTWLSRMILSQRFDSDRMKASKSAGEPLTLIGV